jgi:LuxR family maltose regulon positive regulatory protein
MEIYPQVLEWSDHGIPQKGTVMAHAGLADILCELNEPSAALAQVQSGLEMIDRVGGAWSAYVVYRALARLRQAQGNWVEALDALERAQRIGERAQVDLVVKQAEAQLARLRLAQGDLGAAAIWAANSGLNPDDAEANHPGWREVEYLTLARVLAAQGRHAEALSLLERLSQTAETEKRFGSLIAILAVQALVHQAQGNRNQALENLERALTLAEPEGYLRVFVDEGPSMRALLADFHSLVRQRIGASVDNASLRLLAYTEKILDAFSSTALVQPQTPGTLLEPLSERELEILRLISEGLSNQEIAVLLVVAVSTVKSHINHLYGKLGTHRRTQAVVIARERGLLSD